MKKRKRERERESERENLAYDGKACRKYNKSRKPFFLVNLLIFKISPQYNNFLFLFFEISIKNYFNKPINW